MENNIDLKALWKSQVVPEANTDALRRKIDALRSGKRKNIILINLCLIPTIFFIAWIWFYYQPQYLSTKVGIVLSIAAMVMAIVVHNKLIPLYKALNSDQLNSEYLNNLVLVRQREHFIQTRIISLYFLMLSVGIGLYLYEYASRMSLAGSLATYGITGLWIAFNWIYILPKQIKRNQKKVNDVIEKFEDIKRQLEEEKQAVG